MNQVRKYLKTVSVLLLVCGPAMAAPARPLLAPLRDVTVQYSLSMQDGPAFDLRVEILAGGRHVRVTSPQLPTTLLVDRAAETAWITLPMLRMYSEMNIARYDPQSNLLRGAQFTRGGPGHVAGRACTIWHARSPQGEASGCITDDGVLLEGEVLSAHHSRAAGVRATRLDYGAPPPATFQVPRGYQESPVQLDARGGLQ
jgi:hypothetical protein